MSGYSRTAWMAALARSGMPVGQRYVLLVLSAFANPRTGENAHPAVSTTLTGLSLPGHPERVRAALREAEKRGLITRTGEKRSGGRPVAVYRLTLPDEPSDDGGRPW